MSIKTNELQQMQSILGTDSLLVDSLTAGTGRVATAALAQFMDQELLKPGTALSAALSNKAALSTQNTVEATSVPTRTVEVAAAELRGYIAGLPRLLMEHLTINVSGSLTSGATLALEKFYGPGSLNISMTDQDAICKSPVYIAFNRILISLIGFHFQDPAPGAEYVREAIHVAYASHVCLDNCSFSGNGSESYIAVATELFGYVSVTSGAITGCGKVAVAGVGCVICIYSDLASNLHDNLVGAQTWRSGTVIIGHGLPDALGGASNIKAGGMIVKADGTLL